MATEYIVAICLCCFGIGVGFGMAVPFAFCALYNKMLCAFDLDLYEDGEDVFGGKVPPKQ